MKIAFYHELHKGGARRGTNEFAKQLKNRGHQVDLYTIDKLDSENEFYSNIYNFKFVPKVWQGNNWKKRLYKDSIELYNLWLLNKKIAKDINGKNYDLAYVTASQFIEAPFILSYLKLPIFYYLNDPYYRIIYEPKLFKPLRQDFIRSNYEKINRFVRKHIDKNNISKANYILAASDFTGRQFESIYHKKWITAYYGVDTSFFKPSKENKKIDLLFIGSKDILDGYPFFKQVIKNLKIKNLNIRTILFENEWLNDIQLRKIYQETKVLVGVSYNEPLGLIPLEAMACGAVVIGVNEAGYAETVKNEKTGYLVNRNAAKFSKEIELLLKTPNLLKKYSENAVKDMENWSWKKRGEELEQIIYKLTSRG